MKYVYEMKIEVFYKEGRPVTLSSLFSTKKKALEALEFERKLYADDLTGEREPVVTSAMSNCSFFPPSKRQLDRGATFVARSVERKELY